MNRIPSTVVAFALLAAMAGCMSTPAHLDLSLSRPTVDHRYVVTLQPPARPAAINQLHSWRVTLASPAGVPIAHARIRVDGGMPQHGHGLPTRPQVTQASPDGSYLIEGMKFSMTGWWEIYVAVQKVPASDVTTFNFIVPLPNAR